MTVTANPAPPTSPGPARPAWRTVFSRRRLAHVPMMEALLLGLVIYLAVTTPNFLTVGNSMNILRQVSQIGVIAFGMTMVIIAGEIDLSVGSAVSFAACLTAVLSRAGLPIPLACLAALAAGAALGAFSGLLRTLYRVPTFITTLALMTGLAGAALKLTKGFSVSPPFAPWFNAIGGGSVLKFSFEAAGYVVDFPGLPVPAVIFLGVFAATHFLMNYTTFGRSVYAVGGNAEAARLAGIPVTAVRVLVLAITGVLAALSGVMAASRAMMGDPTAGSGMELNVIAAVIVGGTNITGGAGRVWGTLVGVVFIGVIVNGLTMQNVPSYDGLIVSGAIILAAVLLSRLQQRLA